jgi:hypothetical protein
MVARTEHSAAPAPNRGQPSTFTLLRRNFWLFFGGVFLIAGLLTLIIGAGIAWQESRFASDSVEATGTVLGKSLNRATSERGTEYFVQYRFTDESGTVHDASDQVGFDQWDALVEGGPIAVQYIAGDPGTSRMASDEWFIALLILGVGLLASIIGLLVALPGLRGFRRDRRLWRSGVPAVATVTGVEQSNVRFNGRYMWHVLYRYDAAGTTHQGKSNFLSEGEAHVFGVGAPVAIRYDATRPSDSIWIGGAEE